MDYLKRIGLRAVATAADAFLATLLVAGLTELSISGLQLAAIASAGAGLGVIRDSLRQWLDQTSVVALGRALRADRARQIRELREMDEAKDAQPFRTGGVVPKEQAYQVREGDVLDLSAGTRRREDPRPKA